MAAGAVFLIQALIIIAAPFTVFRLLKLAGIFPLVVVQILLGIALGPSLLGRIWPQAFHFLFNSEVLAPLSGIAWLAVLFFGFITGLHLDLESFRGRGRSFALVAAASIVVPSLFGFFGGLWIAARYATEVGGRIGTIEFATAVGICTGVTALPVLGAIVREMNLLGRRLGDYALALAAVNDMVLWIVLGGLLTVVTATAREGPGLVAGLLILLAYLATMFFVARPMFARLACMLMIDGRLSDTGLAAVIATLIASALVTEVAGLHYVVGAFVAGAIMPAEIRKPVLDRLQVMTVQVLMPFYFMLTGLRTLIDPGSLTFLEIFLVTTVLAVVGKMGGTAIVARLVGEPWRTSLALGALVQTKGLMEVIVLVILLDNRLISATTFSALVLMAVVTTGAAMPIARVALTGEYGRAPEFEPSARSVR
jgi:Kef-type K+ transport system membrane component KefB